MTALSIRVINNTDRPWIARFTAEHWGSDQMIAHGESFTISHLPGFVAEAGG